MSKNLSIEFLGSPGSGKSYYYYNLVKLLIKKKICIYNFQKLFLSYYPQKLSFLQVIKFKIKKKLMQSNNYFIKIFNRVFDKIISFESEINQILNNRKNKIFLKNYFELLHEEKKVDFFLTQKLLKWLRNEISGISIFHKINKKNLILINSEGINQRLSRLNFCNSKIKKIKKINYQNFESDIVIFVDTDIKKCKERINKRKDINYSLEEVKKFKSACKKFYTISKKTKFIVKNKKDFLRVSNNIIKIFYEN